MWKARGEEETACQAILFFSCVLCCAQALSGLLTGENTEFMQQVVLVFLFFFASSPCRNNLREKQILFTRRLNKTMIWSAEYPLLGFHNCCKHTHTSSGVCQTGLPARTISLIPNVQSIFQTQTKGYPGDQKQKVSGVEFSTLE